jgi:phosphate transport system permease protein
MTTASEHEGRMASGGRPRGGKTRRSVIVADRVADWTIKIGGIGVIVAVFGIMAFLAEVVVPLFTGGSVVSQLSNRIPSALGKVLTNRVDEYNTLSVVVSDTGEVRAFHIPTATPIEVPNFDLGARKVTAFARTLSGDEIAFGLDDGTVRFGRLDIVADILPAGELPTGARELDGGDLSDGKAIYSVVAGDQIRKISVAVTLEAPEKVSDGAAIMAIDYRLGGTVERPTKSFATFDAEGVARLSRSETRVNLLTKKATSRTDTATLPSLPKGVEIVDLLMTERADEVYLADRSGALYRYDTRDFDKPALAEKADVAPGAAQLTAIAFLIGEQSIVIGDSTGAVDVYFRIQMAGAQGGDGYALMRAHQLERHDAAVTGIEASQRGKMFATADSSGSVWVRHSTSEQTVLKTRTPDGAAVASLVMSPRENGLLAVGANGAYGFSNIDVPHPETTLKSIFGKIWYEGYPEPTYTWQSSSGTDSFEPKFSLVPLIFGTIKATIYSLLFAVPIALCAAIYTSEFVHHGVRSVVKPTMEMMASLPSVVLGFIAALILAPLVETWIAAVVLAFVLLPIGLFAFAYLWQLLPAPLALRLSGLPKFTLIFLGLAALAQAALAFGPEFEFLFFAGDFRAWANGGVGSDVPFLMLLLLPLCYLAAAALFERLAGARTQEALRALSRPQAGLLDLLRWVVLFAVTVLLSWILAALLAGVGLGPRGGIVDTYVQRNTLVVGFAMGFAVIPIIYTIAEDALNAVPEHLRAASLACGATPWQTAISVILPTAMSGVFAAVMIGMGRAVGETMIVVMAAGNTPILEWNVFNGLRALSANIAVELPEAVKDSTLYRMLFLAALTLFIMTFILNTAAEVIRLRFRRRAAQL